MSDEPDDPQTAWETVQAELADIPGEEGITRRREAYAPYFLRMGRDVRISEGCRFTHPHKIVLDDDVRINTGALIYASGGVWIGRHARIGPRLFVHSANHEVTPDGRAFFERGYDYDSVYVGDNCLISASVSILPGACLAAGTFVACGAVVTQGEYPDGAWIMGVPGKVRQDSLPSGAGSKTPTATPSVALLTPAEGSWRQAAEMLVASLGLPQVRVFTDGDVLPDSVHCAIAMGPEGWAPSAGGHPAVWRLERGDRKAESESRVEVSISTGQPGTIHLPPSRIHSAVPTADPDAPRADNACALSLHYAVKRLSKRQENPSNADRLELYLSIFLLLRHDSPPRRALAEELIALLRGLPDPTSAAEQKLCRLLARPGSTKTISTLLPAVMLELARASESTRQTAARGNVTNFTDRTFLTCPELLTTLTLRDGATFGREFADIVDSLISQATKAMQLVHGGVSALLLDDEARFRKCVDSLLADKFLDERFMCVRSTLKAWSSCYSPVLAVLLLESIWKSAPDYEPRRRRSREEPLQWYCFDTQDKILAVKTNAGGGALLDDATHGISRSLLDNWLLAITPPLIETGQYELLGHNYEPLAAKIESAWMAVFRHLQRRAGRPLIRIRPWPCGYRAAVSIRYDIDRNIQAERMEEIVELHSRHLNAACGSWYAIPGTLFGNRLTTILPRHLQEVGLHALSCRDEAAGRGVTHHSAPNSEYWRGRATVECLEERGAAYGEMVAGQLSRPRPGWLGDAATGRPTSIWFTPLHFPLEGSTDDTDLSYFDRRLEDFRRLLADGGHVIIGSHPDLEQGLLVQLIEREDLSNVWCATVGAAVRRCRQLMDYGAIAVVGCAEKSEDLVARHTIADVQVEIDLPDGETRTVCAQFNANMPRTIAWD